VRAMVFANACKGQGVTVTGTSLECTASSGSPTP